MKVVLPLALFIIMFGMGLSLVVEDFRRVLKFPKAIAVGLFCQMIVLPLIGVGVVTMIQTVIQSACTSISVRTPHLANLSWMLVQNWSVVQPVNVMRTGME